MTVSVGRQPSPSRAAAAIADYAVTGDGRSCAFVSRAGAVDFLCWPRFDSDAVFAALLGDEHHGTWALAPEHAQGPSRRRYREDTAVLETEHACPAGEVRVLDFMPWNSDTRALIRIVEGVKGTVPMCMTLRLRFGYGRVKPWIHQIQRGACAEAGPDRIMLTCGVPVGCAGGDVVARFPIAAGRRVAFTLTHSSSFGELPSVADPDDLLRQTETAWRNWIGHFDRPCRWDGPVRRALITLRQLTDRHTGGVLAAASTSLPETPGGSMNWDYRYCWLRDSTFTLSALLNAGFDAEARRWRDWILRAVAGQPRQMQVAYRVDGGRDLHERAADWLPGWRGATPVRIGNAASGQTQVDTFGELLDCFDVAARAGIERTERVTEIERAIIEHLESAWDVPDAGIWESRGDPHHHTYSQAMAWVGVNRYLKTYAGDAEDEMTGRLRSLEARIHGTVCERGFSAARNHFVSSYEEGTLDGSLLLLPIVGFLPATDPRMAATIAAVERDLLDGGLVRRKPQSAGSADEGAFIVCSCWLADCYQMQGRHDEARAMLERVIALSNDVGLLSEEYHVPTRQLIGNFPQALSHLGVVNTALSLSGPVYQRGGG